MIEFLFRAIRFFVPKWLAGDSLRSQQKSLLRLLAVSHSEGIDPRRLVRNLATEQSGPYRRTLSRLSGWLSAGSSISVSLGRTPGALSKHETLAIQCAIENDRVTETFDLLLRQASEEPPRERPVVSSTVIYITVTSLFLLWVIGLMTFVVPTFEEMFEEFGIGLPYSMLTLIQVMKSFGSYALLIVLAVLLIGVMFQFGEVRRLLHTGFWRHVSPNTPARRRAGILRLLAIPTMSGDPIASTISAAAQFHPESSVRARLMQIRGTADDDPSLLAELAKHGLLRRHEARELSKIDTPSVRGWAMTTLADKKNIHLTQRSRIFGSFARHVPVIVLAILVGWIAVAFIQSLTTLMLPLS
ncbi:MAG: type II secretion system F family protein [Planctomycetota bacterium]